MNYTVIAPFYDAIMSHVGYMDWVNLIDSVTKRFSRNRSTSIFEIGAGTGVLGRYLTERGYPYIGSDLSFCMALQAKTRKMDLFCADARRLPLKSRFDLIIFLYDGINYLQSINEYRKLFVSVASFLPPGGLFLFDITTTANSCRYFFDYSEYQEYDGVSVFRHSYYQSRKSLQINDFTLFFPLKANETLYERKTERHIQRLFKPEQIKSAVPDRLFHCLGIWDDYSMHDYDDDSERVHFLLQRKT